MTRLIWGKIEDRTYESGTSHGVLYREDAPGVVWNGLRSVAEGFEGGDVESFYFEGVKYLDRANARIFKARLKAFSAPREFAECIGEKPLVPGVYLTRQPRVRFGLSYRTQVNEKDYKIHVIYNCTATPTSRGYESKADQISPTELEWDINAVPVLATNHKPTAHYVVDSTKIDPVALAELEAILYGTDTTDPELPDPTVFGSTFPVMEEFLIDLDTDTGFGSLSSDSDGDISETYVEGIFQIVPTGRLTETVDDGFYTLEV